MFIVVAPGQPAEEASAADNPMKSTRPPSNTCTPMTTLDVMLTAWQPETMKAAALFHTYRPVPKPLTVPAGRLSRLSEPTVTPIEAALLKPDMDREDILQSLWLRQLMLGSVPLQGAIARLANCTCEPLLTVRLALATVVPN